VDVVELFGAVSASASASTSLLLLHAAGRSTDAFILGTSQSLTLQAAEATSYEQTLGRR
jgi:hypothetical protein